MRIGCVISTPDVARAPLALLSGTFDQKLQKARVLGYDGVELMVRDPSLLDADAIRAALRRIGLHVPQVVTGELFGSDKLAMVHPDPSVVARTFERLQRIVQFASYLAPGTIVNLGRVRGRADWLHESANSASARRLFIEAFQQIADYSARHDVRLTLEPCNRYEVDFVHNARDGLQVVTEVHRPNFGLMLDVFHMNIEDVSFPAAFREAAPVLWHVHIADSNRLPPGEGHLDFPGIVAALYSIGYSGFVSGEMLPLPDPDQAARITIEFMRKLIKAGDRDAPS